jgi:hypothetical protein
MPTVPTLRRDLREVRLEEVRVGIKEDGKRKKTIIARNSTRPGSSWGIRSTYPQIWSLSYQCGFLPHESPHPSLSNTFPLCHHAAARRVLSSAVSFPVSAEGCTFEEVPALLLVKGYSCYSGVVQPGCGKLVRGVWMRLEPVSIACSADQLSITAVSRSGAGGCS